MKVIDAHCDVLYKLQQAKRSGNMSIQFNHSTLLDAGMKRLQAGRVYVQFFAIFVDPNVEEERRWDYACEQIELFHDEIIGKNKNMKHIRKWSDIGTLSDGEIGAVLTLEGIEPIGNDLNKLLYLYDQGVLSVGLTWNRVNLAADGALERHHGGLTKFGAEIVKLNNDHGVLTDVSHLSELSFWDVLHEAHYVIASHSNVRALCDHPRNLSDIQLNALFTHGGVVNITFYPPFIDPYYERRPITTEDVIRHIDYICSLGGIDYIGFGSDFDGIDLYVEGLTDASDYPSFLTILQNYFTPKEIRGFAQENMLRYLAKVDGDKR